VNREEPRLTVTVLTGFPALFGSLAAEGIIRIALEKGLARLEIVNLRDYTEDRHRTIDDYPYGGGPGMVLKIEPVARALADIAGREGRQEARREGERGTTPGDGGTDREGGREVILLSPQGKPLTQEFFERRADAHDLILICGRYKGIDERIRALADTEVSLGDYVISGGELGAMVLIDGLFRLIPGVLGDFDSARGDSFSTGILDCAYYTRPESWREQAVPEVLLSGNHGAIRRWRREDALRRTFERRPDLLAGAELDEEDRRFLRALGWQEAR